MRRSVHSHTWYANFGGHLAKLLYGVPHVMTSHSLEPLRPWKAEQLGGGYALSSFCERTAIESADAVIAVSRGMANDVAAGLPRASIRRRVDGDPQRHRPRRVPPGPADRRRWSASASIPTPPIVMWIGRVTAPKGHRPSARHGRAHSPPTRSWCFSPAPPTRPRSSAEVPSALAELAERRTGVHWIEAMLPRPEVVQLLSHATVFVCPSIYEPFGLINVEAMACGVPVVATAVGGIPEIVVDGVTGYLVVPLPDDPTSSGRHLPSG